MPPAPPGAAPPSPVLDFNWSHAGDPDLTDAAVISALQDDLMVILPNTAHKFIKATPFLPWTVEPGAAAGDPAVGKRIPQSVFDRLCMIGGRATAWLRSHNNVLALSHRPLHGRGILAALTAAGGLSLDVVYDTFSWRPP